MHKIYEEELTKIVGVEETVVEQDTLLVRYLLKGGSYYTAIVELGDKLHGDINRFLLNPSISINNTREKDTELMVRSLMDHVKLFYRFNESMKYYKHKRAISRQEHVYFSAMHQVLESFKKRVLGQIKTARKLHLFDHNSTAFNHLLELLETQDYLDTSKEMIDVLAAYANEEYCLNPATLLKAIYGETKLEEWNNKVFGKAELNEQEMPRTSTTSPVRIRK